MLPFENPSISRFLTDSALRRAVVLRRHALPSLALPGVWHLLATALSDLALTAYDAFAPRILSHRLPDRRVVLASFMAIAVGHYRHGGHI